MFDEGSGDDVGVFGAVGEDVEAARGEAGLLEDGADGPEAAGGELGTFEDGGVAGCQGVGDGAETEDVGCIPGGGGGSGGVEVGWKGGALPGCNAEHDAVGFFVYNCALALFGYDGYLCHDCRYPSCNIL